MKTRYSDLIVAIAFAIITSLSSFGANVNFTYATDDNTDRFGFGKAETYDVAIRLQDISFIGTTVKSFSVPMPKGDYITDVKGWLSKELKLEKVDKKKVNVPDIVSVDAVVEDGILNVDFAEGYTIGDEGVYVGYSFTVSQVTADNGDGITEAEKPIFVQNGDDPNGLYIHTSNSFRNWKPLGRSTVCCVTVTLDGDFAPNSVSINQIPNTRIRVGENSVIPIEIANMGMSEVESIDYQYELEGETKNGSVYLEYPVKAIFNSKSIIEIPIDAVNNKGKLPISVEITKVNDELNGSLHQRGEGFLRVVSSIPVHRPLMEEYTGTWCGWCTRGFAALEYMNRMYPQDFIAVAYHNKDPMAVTNSYPNEINGFPSAWLDRSLSVDPYNGTKPEGFGIEEDWRDMCEVESPVNLEVSASLSELGDVEITTHYTFVEEVSGSYKLVYMLCEDGMYGGAAQDPDYDSNWSQNNSYSGSDPDDYIPELVEFCESPAKVDGLYFNDVLVMFSDIMGIEGSVERMSVDQDFSHSYKFEDIFSTLNIFNKQPIIQSSDKLSVVVAMVDSKGKVINANKAAVSDPSGVELLPSANSSMVVSTRYVDLAGRCVSNPVTGIYIKIDTLQNGMVRISKIMAVK